MNYYLLILLVGDLLIYLVRGKSYGVETLKELADVFFYIADEVTDARTTGAFNCGITLSMLLMAYFCIMGWFLYSCLSGHGFSDVWSDAGSLVFIFPPTWLALAEINRRVFSWVT